MELKIKFNDKEKRVLKLVLAIVLCICAFAMGVLSLTYIGIIYELTGKPYLATAIIISLITTPIYFAIFKHYK